MSQNISPSIFLIQLLLLHPCRRLFHHLHNVILPIELHFAYHQTILLLQDLLCLRGTDTWKERRHVHDRALVQRRHELTANP